MSAVERLAEQWNSTPDYLGSDYDRGRVEQRHMMTTQLLEAIAEDRAGVVTEEPDITALRAARAETWDEAIAAVFAWWAAPEDERPGLIVNPYGVGLPLEQGDEVSDA